MSDSPADTATDDTPTDEPADKGDTTDWQAEAEKWKAQARKHEERAKSRAGLEKELAELKAKTMTETEKAIADARAEARAEALSEAGAKIARAEFKAATADRMDDDGLEALLAGLDLKAFLDDNGDVDAGKIAAFVDRIAPKPETSGYQPVDLGQGARGGEQPGAKDPLLATVKSIAGITR